MWGHRKAEPTVVLGLHFSSHSSRDFGEHRRDTGPVPRRSYRHCRSDIVKYRADLASVDAFLHDDE